jgi:hypothetical protein
LANYHRDLVIADFNRDGIPDVAVVNTSAGDISVLLGRGDGTFEPQRRFNATAAPFALAVGDLNNDGIPDLAVVDSTAGPAQGGVLLGRGDGTFLPLIPFPITPGEPFRTNAIRIADLNHDGNNDLVVRDFVDGTIELLGNGDGTFRLNVNAIQTVNGPGIAIADLNGDGNPDVVTTLNNTSQVQYTLGNGDGTFQPDTTSNFSGQFPVSVAVVDFATVNPDGSVVLGVPDGHPDLIVANNGRSLPTLNGPPEVVLLPGLVGSLGQFAGFGDPIHLASPKGPLDVEVGDVNGDSVPDIVVVDRDGIMVIYGKQPVIPSNATPQTARNLGTVVHLLEPTQTIVPSHEDAYFTLTVPTEAVPGAGDEILDFSGFFQYAQGAGLAMEVRDTAGNLLGSGERLRIHASQGEVLTLHIYGLPAAGSNRGVGAFTLDIDVLPQVVSFESQPLLPGVTVNPGGPTTSLVIILQGDRLDPAAAKNPANYVVTWLGPDGLAGTADDQVIPINGNVASNQPVVYDPSSNVDVASGVIFPTAVRQAVTLVFADPLPAGSYQIELSPAIQTAAFNVEEANLLTSVTGFNGHPVVSLSSGSVTEGSRQTALGLVLAAGTLGDFSVFETGTRFLTQLHDDLGSLLDAALTTRTDNPAISQAINNQILDRFIPALGPAGQRPVGMLVIWLDPPGSAVIADPQLRYASLNRGASSFQNGIPDLYVNISFNIEVLVRPLFAGSGGIYTLDVSDVSATARGGVVILGIQNLVMPLTSALRAGQQHFEIPVFFPLPPVTSSPPPVTPAPPTAPDSGPVVNSSNSQIPPPPRIDPGLIAAVVRLGNSPLFGLFFTDSNAATSFVPVLINFLTGTGDTSLHDHVYLGGRHSNSPNALVAPADPEKIVKAIIKALRKAFSGTADGLGQILADSSLSTAAVLRSLLELIGGMPLTAGDPLWQKLSSDITTALRETGSSTWTEIGDLFGPHLLGPIRVLASSSESRVVEQAQEEDNPPFPVDDRSELRYPESMVDDDQTSAILLAAALLLTSWGAWRPTRPCGNRRDTARRSDLERMFDPAPKPFQGPGLVGFNPLQ